MPGFGGGVARALGSDDVNVVKKVKNPAIESAINSALSDYNKYTSGEQTALSDYINKYLGQQGQFEKNVGQESGAIGQFYTGEMANKLGALRQQRSAAVNAAADVGVKQALANVDRSRVGEEGGTSSYDRRLAMGAVLPIRTQAALDNSNQERADLGYVTQNQLGLTGQRENLANALAGYGLVPYQTAANISGRNIGQLSGLTNLDQANTFYGLKKPKNTFADIADSLDAGVLSAASMYSSAGGGMKRGGLVWNYTRGGPVRGPGTTHSDSIPINVSHGEYVMPASAVSIPGVLPLLHRIRAAGLASEGLAHPLSQEIQMDRAQGWRSPKTNYDEGGGIGFGGDGWAMSNPEGYDSGGFYGGDYANSDGGGGGGGKQRQPKQGGGGYGGGLSGEAMQLRDRAAQDQNANWMGATIIPNAGGGGGWGMPSTKTGTMPPGAGAIPKGNDIFDFSHYMRSVYGAESVPDNFHELTADQQAEYSSMYGRARNWEKQWAGQPNPYE